MDDEFKLCWKNFQDNIASGFQNLYDRGDLVDVTLACDGKLLHAHKIVLAICSPYFQEIFITNPCKHPIIILKDVTFNIMCELLEFMYQGVVNVKHIELQSFMKIGQLLQIKGLATNSTPSAPSTSSSEKSSSQNQQNPEEVASACSDALSNTITKIELNNADNSSSKTGNTISTSIGRSQSPSSTPSPMAFTTTSTNQVNMKTSALNNPILPHPYHSLKRHADFGSDTLSIYSRKPFKRSTSSVEHIGDHNDSTTEVSMDQVNAEDFFLPTIPHISMIEPRYDLNNVKREGDRHSSSTTSVALRNSFGTAFGFDYNLYKNSTNTNSGAEYPNDLHMPNDYSKNFGNHMDIPPIAPGEHWFQGKLEFMLSQRGKPLLVHDGHTFGIQYVRKDKKYWQCNLSRKFNCKARVTTTDTGEIIVTNNEHCHTEIRQHLRKDYQRNKVMMNALINLTTNRYESMRRQNAHNLSNLSSFQSIVSNSCATAPFSTHTAADDDAEPGILDLGKVPRESAITQHQAEMQGEDVPLDCGLRSLATSAEMSKIHNPDDNDTPIAADWKIKKEIIGTQSQ